MIPTCNDEASTDSATESKQHEPRQHARRRGSVTFNESIETREFEPVTELGDPDIVGKLWFQPWEKQENKRMMRERAREWRRLGWGVLLHDSFTNPNPKLTQSCLNAFTQLSDPDYCRGMERYLSQEHDEQRSERKRSVIDDVLEQARYLESRRNLSYDEKCAKLAEFSALQSKCAEVFARRIGKADEAVALQGEDPEQASKLVGKLLRRQQQQESGQRRHHRHHVQHLGAGGRGGGSILDQVEAELGMQGTQASAPTAPKPSRFPRYMRKHSNVMSTCESKPVAEPTATGSRRSSFPFVSSSLLSR